MRLKPLPYVILTTCALLVATMARAHEFWLEPLDYTLDPGQELQVEIRIGQDFKGNEYSFNPTTFYDYSLRDSAGKRPIEGRTGDMPSVQMMPQNSGLLVLNHFSTSQMLTYREAEKFTAFVTHKGMLWVLDRHHKRGLPDVGFSEGYTRFAKTLIAVGNGTGTDAPTGMPIELVALANPYTDDLDTVPVQLIWQGAPVPNAQLDIFHKADRNVEATLTLVQTNDSGIAQIPVTRNGDYLINAVQMTIPSAADIERTGAVWHSLWASLTFRIEGK